MTDATRAKVRKRITHIVSALDDDQLKLIYYLTTSAYRNQTRKNEKKGSTQP